MAIMAGAQYKPINYSGVPRMRSAGPNVVCVHTIVGNDPAPAAHFSTRSDGYVTQSRDTAYQSAANLNGNPRIIAIENDDQDQAFGDWNEGDGHAVPAFTSEQCESIAHICVWAHKTHGVPLVPATDSKTSSAGIAYHRQGIDGNWSGYAYGGRVEGGEHWSSSAGKVCPGDRRINQLLNVIIPRARVLAGLDEGADLDSNQAMQLTKVYQSFFDSNASPGQQTVYDALWAVDGKVNDANAAIDAINDKLDAIIAALPGGSA